MNLLDTALMTNSTALRQALPNTEQAKAKLSDAQMKKIDETAQEFEAVFISEMIKPMFEGLKTDTMFGGGQAEEMFRSIMIQEYGKSMAQTGSIGIADSVKAHLINAQAGNL